MDPAARDLTGDMAALRGAPPAAGMRGVAAGGALGALLLHGAPLQAGAAGEVRSP